MRGCSSKSDIGNSTAIRGGVIRYKSRTCAYDLCNDSVLEPAGGASPAGCVTYSKVTSPAVLFLIAFMRRA